MAGPTIVEVTCPRCGYAFPLTDAVMGPLRTQISSELQSEYDDKLKKERQEIEKVARESAHAAATQEITDLAEQLQKANIDLKESREAEKQFREERRKWKEEKENIELTIQRRMDAFTSEYDEKQKLRDKSKDEQIGRMTKTIEDLQRQVEQGSQQAQGEVLEITLEETLKACFPQDEILPVPKGVRGADLIQRVNGKVGLCCGTIIWESKNTKNWSTQWVDKLKENQDREKADIAIIASVVLPDSIEHFGQVDDVWVTRWSLASQVASTMRMALIGLHKAKQAGESKDEKMELLYNYLTGGEFAQRINSVGRAFLRMQQELNQERAAMERIWSRREKQLELVARGTTGMIGDLEAIAGATIPQIEALSLLPQLEEGEDTE
jgi:hypothetical protein